MVRDPGCFSPNPIAIMINIVIVLILAIIVILVIIVSTVSIVVIVISYNGNNGYNVSFKPSSQIELEAAKVEGLGSVSLLNLKKYPCWGTWRHILGL